MEKKNNKKKVVKPYDTRAVGVQLDRVEHSLQVIAEQHGDIKETLDSHTEMIGALAIDVKELKTDVKELKTDVAVLETDVTTLETDMKEVKADVKELKTDVTALKTDMKEVKADVTTLKTDVTEIKRDTQIMKTDIEFIKTGLKKKVDVEEFAALEHRVAMLERRRG